jgi:hypothetical protein
MKLLQLSRLTIDLNIIVAVEEDKDMVDGRKTTLIYHNLPNTGMPFQLYSDNPNYEKDKAKLMTALVNNREYSE